MKRKRRVRIIAGCLVMAGIVVSLNIFGGREGWSVRPERFGKYNVVSVDGSPPIIEERIGPFVGESAVRGYVDWWAVSNDYVVARVIDAPPGEAWFFPDASPGFSIMERSSGVVRYGISREYVITFIRENKLAFESFMDTVEPVMP
ncbi:MAG: hypothetical protein AAF297_03045 [Planctomycetota bacterium]